MYIDISYFVFSFVVRQRYNTCNNVEYHVIQTKDWAQILSQGTTIGRLMSHRNRMNRWRERTFRAVLLLCHYSVEVI